MGVKHLPQLEDVVSIRELTRLLAPALGKEPARGLSESQMSSRIGSAYATRAYGLTFPNGSSRAEITCESPGQELLPSAEPREIIYLRKITQLDPNN